MRPLKINCSQSRRAATPASANAFCRRIPDGVDDMARVRRRGELVCCQRAMVPEVYLAARCGVVVVPVGRIFQCAVFTSLQPNGAFIATNALRRCRTLQTLRFNA